MSKIITLRKGLDINLRGKAQESLADAPQASEYALSPLDFEGVTPKLLVKVGDEGKAGTPLFFLSHHIDRQIFLFTGRKEILRLLDEKEILYHLISL